MYNRIIEKTWSSKQDSSTKKLKLSASMENKN